MLGGRGASLSCDVSGLFVAGDCLMMKYLIGILIRLYRRSPMYPGWGGRLAKLLGLMNRLRRRGPFVHELDGFRMHIDLDEIIDSQIYYTGSFEPDTVATLNRLLSPGAVAIDIGANIGALTLHMAERVGRDGRVIAFEPTPWAYDKLLANLALNDMPHVLPERLGLSDTPCDRLEAAIQSSYRVDGRSSHTRGAIAVTTLDSYAAEHPMPRLDFIKIDTDGMEFAIVRGASATLARFRPSILFELGPDALRDARTSAAELVDYLRTLGYGFHREVSLEPFDDLLSEAGRLPADTSMNVVALPG